MRIQSIQNNNTTNQSANFKAKFIRNSILEQFTKQTAERLDDNCKYFIPSEAERVNKIFQQYLEKFRDIKFDYPIEMCATNEDIRMHDTVLYFHFPSSQKDIYDLNGNGPRSLSYKDCHSSAFTCYMKQFMCFVDELAKNSEEYAGETTKAKYFNKIMDIIT